MRQESVSNFFDEKSKTFCSNKHFDVGILFAYQTLGCQVDLTTAPLPLVPRTVQVFVLLYPPPAVSFVVKIFRSPDKRVRFTLLEKWLTILKFRVFVQTLRWHDRYQLSIDFRCKKWCVSRIANSTSLHTFWTVVCLVAFCAATLGGWPTLNRFVAKLYNFHLLRFCVCGSKLVQLQLQPSPTWESFEQSKFSLLWHHIISSEGFADHLRGLCVFVATACSHIHGLFSKASWCKQNHSFHTSGRCCFPSAFLFSSHGHVLYQSTRDFLTNRSCAFLIWWLARSPTPFCIVVFFCKLALVQLHLQSILKEIYLVCRTESFCITHSANPRLLRTLSAFLCLFFQLLTVSFLAISIDCQTKIHRSHDLLLRISHTFCALFFLASYSCYHIRIQLQEFMSPKTSQHPRWVLMSVLPVATMLKLFPSMIVLTNLSQNLTRILFFGDSIHPRAVAFVANSPEILSAKRNCAALIPRKQCSWNPLFEFLYFVPTSSSAYLGLTIRYFWGQTQ